MNLKKITELFVLYIIEKLNTDDIPSILFDRVTFPLKAAAV